MITEIMKNHDFSWVPSSYVGGGRWSYSVCIFVYLTKIIERAILCLFVLRFLFVFLALMEKITFILRLRNGLICVESHAEIHSFSESCCCWLLVAGAACC